VIHYLKGDATSPQSDTDIKIIMHICNDVGAWGAGFVLALSKKWSKPEIEYKKWKKTFPDKFKLGNIQQVYVGDGIYVANMIAQKLGKKYQPPIRYSALDKCLIKLSYFAQETKDKYGKTVSIHAPRIGCGLAGGTWDEIEYFINKHLSEFDVYIYDFEQ